MDRTGYRYRQLWIGVDTNWVGVWTKLGYPMYSFLHIYKESIINSGLDSIPASPCYVFSFAIKYFDRQIYEMVLRWNILTLKL